MLFNCASVYLWYASNVATFIADHLLHFMFMLYNCVCVYLWYASNVATFIADHLTSFYVLCYTIVFVYICGMLAMWPLL